MSEVFAQDLCTMEPFKDSMRWVITRKQTPASTVRVADGELTITLETGELLARVPTAGLRIVTPRRLRKMECGVVVELDGKPVAVMFDLIHSRQQFRAAQQRGGDGAVIRQMAKPAANTRGNMALAAAITAKFMAALLAGGAIDATG